MEQVDVSDAKTLDAWMYEEESFLRDLVFYQDHYRNFRGVHASCS